MIELERQGLTVYEFLNPAAGTDKNWLTRDLRLFRSNLSSEALAELSWFLASTLSSGHTLDSATEMASEIHSTVRVRKLLVRVRIALQSGLNVGDAFRSVTGFPEEFVVFVSGGNSSNALANAFSDAAKYFEQRGEIKSRALTAMAYPIFLVIVGIGVLMMITFYLTPTLHRTIVASGQEVTGVLNALEVFRSWVIRGLPLTFVALVTGLAGIVFGGIMLVRAICFKTPVLQRSFQARDFARIGRVLAALIGSGVPLSKALADCLPIASKPQASLLRAAIGRLESGEPTGGAFEESPNVPFAFTRLYAFGERANQLPASLTLASEIMETQYRAFTSKLVALISPVLTLIVGTCIGVLVYVVISAVLQVSSLATL